MIHKILISFLALCSFSILFSQEQGWKAEGPFYGKSKTIDYMHSMGLVNAVLTNPLNDKELIVSTNSSGIWKTKDRGVYWKCVTEKKDFIPGMGIKTFSVNPDNPNEIIAGGGNYCYGDDNYGGCVLFSKDRGETWTKNISFEKDYFLEKLVSKVVYHSKDLIYVMTNTKLLKSKDSGGSWEVIFELNQEKKYIDNKDQTLIDLEIFKNGNLFLSTTHNWGSKGNLFRSINSGKSWDNLLKTEEFDNVFNKHILFVTMTKPLNGKMYVGLGSGGDVQLFKTTNQGDNFYKSGVISTRHPSIDAKAGKFEMEISIVNPEKLYVGSIDLFVWDSIKSLRQLSPNGNISRDEHADVRYLSVQMNGDKEEVVMGNDGGITIYKPDSNKFEGLNGYNFPTLQVYNLAISQFDKNFMMYIGTQDNGTYEYKDKDWNFISGGDGGGNVMDDQGHLKINSINGTVVVFNGKAKRYFSPNRQFSSWYLDFPIELSRSDSTILFGSKKRGKAKNGRLYIQNLKNKNHVGIEVDGINSLGEIAISNTNPNIILIAEGGLIDGKVKGRKLVKTINRGSTFIDLSNALVFPHPLDLISRGRDTVTLRSMLGYRKITDIEIDPYDNEIIYISINGNFKPESWTKNWEYYRVLKSEDGGESWVNYSLGLPNTPIYCLLRDERDENILFCGGDEGIFEKDYESQEWKKLDKEFPKNVTVTDIKINYCQEKLYCSTYGRGVYSLNLFTISDYQEIEKDETWDSYRFVKRDIEIKRGKTLTITNDIAMAPNTSITLQPKSKLIIDGATVSSKCLGNWNGITIKEKKFLFLFKRRKGKVEYKNGGKLENSLIELELFY